MSTGIIRAPSRAPYDIVRRDVVRDRRLRYAARGVLLRLLSNAAGYSMTAADLAAESPDGRAAVLSALRQLRDLGYVVTTRRQVQGGRWRTDTYVREDPTEVQLPNSGSPDSGPPDVGGPDPKSSNSNKQIKQQQGRQGGPAAGAAAAPVELARGKRRRTHRDAGGMVTWSSEEVGEPGELVARHGLAAVAEAVQAVTAAGLDPVPGRVAAQLARQTAASAAAQRAAAKAEREATAAARRDEQAAAAAQRRATAAQRLAELDGAQRDAVLARFAARIAASHPMLAPTLTTSGPDHPMLRAMWGDYLAAELAGAAT